jgi:uncharacterized protein YggL (DUF469 family)
MTIDEALIYFQEIGFQVNELKKKNVKTVDIDTYENLLNWVIEALRMQVGMYDEFGEILNKYK